MINAVENAQRGDICYAKPMCQTLHRLLGPQRFEWLYVYAIKWVKPILGCTSLEIRIVHMRPNLGPIQGQTVFWREVVVDDPQFLRGQLGRAFQMIAILTVTRNAQAQCTDNGRGYKESILEDWRYDK